jgi:excisionase family DNA binding protein
MSKQDSVLDCDILTVKEAAQFLKIGRSKLYEAVSKQQVPFFRIGRSIRFSKNKLQEMF